MLSLFLFKTIGVTSIYAFLKPRPGNTNPYLRALMAKCELSYQIPALGSIPPKTKPYNGLFKPGISNNRFQPNKQTPAPNSIQFPSGYD